MEMPEKTEAHQRLARIAGYWVGPETVCESPIHPAGGTTRGVIDNRLALDGFAVVQDYRQEKADGSVAFHTRSSAALAAVCSPPNVTVICSPGSAHPQTWMGLSR